jgi:hypothetical protein
MAPSIAARTAINVNYDNITIDTVFSHVFFSVFGSGYRLRYSLRSLDTGLDDAESIHRHCINNFLGPACWNK